MSNFNNWKTPSKICNDYFKLVEYNKHLQTIQSVKSRVDNKSPIIPYFKLKRGINKYI